MSGTTPTWGLTYTTGSDALCDYGPVYIAALAAELETIFAGFNATLSRLLVLPYASVTASVAAHSAQLGTSTPILAFDTVNEDNYGWTNLAISPGVISVAAPAGSSYILMGMTAVIVDTISTYVSGGVPSLGESTNWSGNSPTSTPAGGTTLRVGIFTTTPSQQYFTMIGDTTGNVLPSAGYSAFGLWMGDVS